MSVELPPHDKHACLYPGDPCVIIMGEQAGKRGTVKGYDAQHDAYRVAQTLSTGVTSQVVHRAEVVALLLPTPPKFPTPEHAEAWMAMQQAEREERRRNERRMRRVPTGRTRDEWGNVVPPPPF